MIRSAGAFHILSATLILLAQGFLPMAAVKEPSRLVPPTQVGDWKLVARDGQQVTSTTIFDYMDGAGELYLAYDFEQLKVWKYTRNGDTTITVEAYEMGSPVEAFGVLSQDLDGEAVGVGQESVYAAGLLRFWQGRWFISVLVEVETPETRRAVLALGQAFAVQVRAEGRRPELLSRLPADGLVARSIHYFHTAVILNSFYFFAVENLLQLNERTEAAMAEYRFDKQPTNLLVVRYPDAAAAAKARTTFREKYLKGLTVSPEPVQLAQLESGEWAGLKLDGNYLIVAFRSRSRDVCSRLLQAVNSTSGGKKT